MTFKGKVVLSAAVCFLAVLINGQSVYGASLNFTGVVTPDKQNLRIRVTVEGTIAELGEDEATYTSRLEVYLLDSDDNPIIPPGGDLNAESSTLNQENYWENIDNPYLEPSTTDKYQIRYHILVSNNNTGSATGERTIEDLLQAHGVIRARVRFTRVDGSTVNNSSDQDLQVLTSVPNEAPQNFELVSIHKGVRVSWKGKTSVAHTVGANQSDVQYHEPQNVLVMTFPGSGANQLPIQGAQVNSDTGVHTDLDCLFEYGEGGSESCISCPGAAEGSDFFIKSVQEKGVGVFNLVPNNADVASTVVSGLDVGTEYIVVLQYEQGAARTECKSVTPIETVSLSELNGEAGGTEGDPRCFIASAAFGSPFAKEVKTFRWFRDTFLLPYAWGKSVVEFYYLHSPKLVEPMSHSEALRSAIRFLLWPVALCLSFVQKLYKGELEAIFFLLGLGIVFFGLLLRFRYRLNFPFDS